MRFDLKRPCANCPFRPDGEAIELRPGRLESIVAELRADDHVVFQCHKTAHGARPKGEESACIGALAFMWREGRDLPVFARVGIALGWLSVEDIERARHDIRAGE